MFGVAKPQWLWIAFKGDLGRYFNCVLKNKKGWRIMIDRFLLDPGERYEFQTDGQYVVVVSVGNSINVYKGSSFLAKLDWFETYSCPANTGPYIIENPTENPVGVLLVRYVLV
jgi:hypothetical protein